MKTLIIFLILSIPIIYFSRRNLFSPKSHGFYRFLSWECIAWLTAANYKYWYINPFCLYQLISWVLLTVGAIVVIMGVIQIKAKGKADLTRNDSNLYQFEKTTKLVDSGIYKYIRHPLYASLIYVTWGIFFKNPNLVLCLISMFSSVFLYITSRFDEKECIEYFGTQYKQYMKNTKMFVPFLF